MVAMTWIMHGLCGQRPITVKRKGVGSLNRVRVRVSTTAHFNPSLDIMAATALTFVP